MDDMTHATMPLPHRRKMSPRGWANVLLRGKRYAALREALCIAAVAFCSMVLAYHWLGAAAP